MYSEPSPNVKIENLRVAAWREALRKEDLTHVFNPQKNSTYNQMVTTRIFLEWSLAA